MTEINENFSDRGFIHLEEIATDYGAIVRIYESSSAEAPKLWMAAEQPPPRYSGALEAASVHVHMTIEQAERIRDNLTHMIQRTKERWGE